MWAAGTAEPNNWMFQQTGWTSLTGGAPALNGGSGGLLTDSFASVSVTTTSVLPDTASAGSAFATTTISAASSLPPTRFEFGTATSPIDAGFTKVDASTTYSAALGYGCTTAGIQERDRGVGSDMNRAFDFTVSPATFQVDLPQGAYQISLTSGDADYAQGPEGIFINGTQVDTISTQVNQFVTDTYQVAIGNAGLHLQIVPLSGGTVNALINELVINQALRATQPHSPHSDAHSDPRPQLRRPLRPRPQLRTGLPWSSKTMTAPLSRLI